MPFMAHLRQERPDLIYELVRRHCEKCSNPSCQMCNNLLHKMFRLASQGAGNNENDYAPLLGLAPCPSPKPGVGEVQSQAEALADMEADLQQGVLAVGEQQGLLPLPQREAEEEETGDPVAADWTQQGAVPLELMQQLHSLHARAAAAQQATASSPWAEAPEALGSEPDCCPSLEMSMSGRASAPQSNVAGWVANVPFSGVATAAPYVTMTEQAAGRAGRAGGASQQSPAQRLRVLEQLLDEAPVLGLSLDPEAVLRQMQDPSSAALGPVRESPTASARLLLPLEDGLVTQASGPRATPSSTRLHHPQRTRPLPHPPCAPLPLLLPPHPPPSRPPGRVRCQARRDPRRRLCARGRPDTRPRRRPRCGGVLLRGLLHRGLRLRC